MTGVLQWLFVLSVAFALYTVIGYPLVLAILTRYRSRPVRKRFAPRTITVLLPVRNGSRWIEAKLKSLLAQNYPPELVDIIVISDGSTDGTDEIVRSFEATGRVRLLRVPGGGKAVAINAGLAEAGGELLFFTDVRQIITPDSLRNLTECFGDPEVGAASGEIVIRKGETLEEMSIGAYWKYEKWIRKHQSRIGSVTGVSGCVYMIPREFATPLPAGTLLDDMYMPTAILRRGYRVIFEEGAVALDLPTSLDSEFARKVRTQAGVYQIIAQFPWLLTPRNPILLHFLSHKVARLLLPWMLIATAIGTYALPEPWRMLAAAGQIAFYGVALIDGWLPKGFPLKRISAPARSFLVLLAAAAAAVRVLFTPAGRLWKETRVTSAHPTS
jgi:cellulose synthase/poly-beta-1,6-N-acetylglucosamine synthase-like glycosyltransferase